MKKALLIIGTVLLVLFFGVLLWLRFGVDEELLQSTLADALGPEYVVEIESARVSPLSRSVSIGRMTISTSEEQRIIFQTDTLHIAGINPGMVFRKNILLSTLKMDRFTIALNASELSAAKPSGGENPLQKLEINALDLTNGSINIKREGKERRYINAFNMKAGFVFEFPDAADSLKSLQQSVEIDSLGFLFADNLYRFSLSGLNYARQDSLLRLSAMDLSPVGGYAQFMGALVYEANMFEIALNELTASGIDVDAYLNEQTLKARSLDFEAFRVHVSKNKQLLEKPDKKDKLLLNKIVQRLPFAIQADTLHLRNTDIQYSEQHENGARPGTVSFMNSTIHMYDVDSRSPEPAILIAATFFQNHSRVDTELRFTLDDGPFYMMGSGTLQPFEMIALNSIAMDRLGIEIVSGFINELAFDFEIEGDSSSGSMHLLYENLKIDMVDMGDHEESFQSSVLSLLTNKVALMSKNEAEGENKARTGEIKNVRAPDSSFFQHIWHSLRSGIIDIILRI